MPAPLDHWTVSGELSSQGQRHQTCSAKATVEWAGPQRVEAEMRGFMNQPLSCEVTEQRGVGLASSLEVTA